MLFESPNTINDLPLIDDYIDTHGFARASIAFRIDMVKYTRCRLSEAQNHRCCWCGRHTTDERGRGHSATVEHVVPKAEGGSDDMDNLVMACMRCNNERGRRSAEDYLTELVRRRSEYTARQFRQSWLSSQRRRK